MAVIVLFVIIVISLIFMIKKSKGIVLTVETLHSILLFTYSLLLIFSGKGQANLESNSTDEAVGYMLVI